MSRTPRPPSTSATRRSQRSKMGLDVTVAQSPINARPSRAGPEWAERDGACHTGQLWSLPVHDGGSKGPPAGGRFFPDFYGPDHHPAEIAAGRTLVVCCCEAQIGSWRSWQIVCGCADGCADRLRRLLARIGNAARRDTQRPSSEWA